MHDDAVRTLPLDAEALARPQAPDRLAAEDPERCIPTAPRRKVPKEGEGR
jgi:hypothetical protein